MIFVIVSAVVWQHTYSDRVKFGLVSLFNNRSSGYIVSIYIPYQNQYNVLLRYLILLFSQMQ